MASMEKALKHFDKFYPFIYSASLWRSIRIGLLCQSKKMFLINTSYNETNKLINVLKKSGAINFLDNLIVKENKSVYIENEYEYSNHDEMLLGTQINEFVRTTKYIGERSIISKSIKGTFTDYSTCFDEKASEDVMKNLSKCKSMMLDYETINLPLHMQVLAYPKGIVKPKFPNQYDKFNQSGFYSIDGFSILVVLMMNIKKGDKILDMCAAPGGKTVAMLHTNLPEEIVCIDKSSSRLQRLKKVINGHAYPKDVQKVNIIEGDSITETRYMNGYFDKVLLDAPCSSDRHALNERNFSLFLSQNKKKRSELHDSQYELLKQAISCCKVGGDIIYSTCTLSPVQNDNVVATIIEEINSEGNNFQLRVVKCNSNYLSRRQKQVSEDVERLTNDWFYTHDSGNVLGEVILPNIINNYGPGYVCKIRKVPLA